MSHTISKRAVQLDPTPSVAIEVVRTRRRRPNIGVRLAQAGILVAFLIVWQVGASLNWIDPALARTPLQVATFLVDSTASGELWTNTLATLLAAIIAFLLGGAAGVVVGVALGLLPRVEKVVSPFIDMINAMPRIALAPVFIIFFGIGIEAKVALAFTFVFFIVMSGARAGVRTADSEIVRLSTVLGATKVQMFQSVLIPVAVPGIFASLRLGLIYSMLGVIGSEIISSRDGLGQLVARYSGSFQMEAVYGIIILLAVLATVLNQLMNWLERNLLKWQAPADR